MKHIFKNNYYFPILLVAVCLLVLILVKMVNVPLLKYPVMLGIAAFTFYLNPILIITTFTNQQYQTIASKLTLVMSYIILSVIFSLTALFLFATNENILFAAKIICIINFFYTAAVYFSNSINKALLRNHLAVSILFTTLVAAL